MLHRRPWRDSSLILELFSRGHGRLGAVGRGARSPRSALAGMSEPFRLVEASWKRAGELATLTGLEPVSPGTRLTGRAVWCGLYANELLLKLVPRDDPEPGVFDAYRALLGELFDSERQASALRRFEYVLLTALGVLPGLAVEADTGNALDPRRRYRIEPQSGPLTVASGGVAGSTLLKLDRGRPLDPDEAAALRSVMRKLIDLQLDGRSLKTPGLFREMPA